MGGTPLDPGAALRTTAIFTKRPEAGRVKTRLCPPLSPPQAARLAEAMLADIVEAHRDRPEYRCALLFAPSDERAWFEERFPGHIDLRPQAGPDLAGSLGAFFREELAGPTTGAVVLGSDAPHLPRARVLEAHRALQGGADLVLGPDLGGGYYLIGLARPVDALFEEVEMSTRDMCARTVELARARGLEVALLEPDFDVDEEADLVRLCTRLARGSGPDPIPPRTAALLAELFPQTRTAETP